MKRTILFLTVIFIFTITGFCQSNEEVVKTQVDLLISDSHNPITYYCTNTHEDSSVLSKDTLVLVKTLVNDNPPMLVLTKDSKFIFTYNIDFKTRKIRNDQTGELMEMPVDNSKHIEGRWKSNDIHKAITFILGDQSVVNYKIKEEGNFICFIKVKHE